MLYSFSILKKAKHAQWRLQKSKMHLLSQQRKSTKDVSEARFLVRVTLYTAADVRLTKTVKTHRGYNIYGDTIWAPQELWLASFGCHKFLMVMEIVDGEDNIKQVEESLLLFSITHLAKLLPLQTFCSLCSPCSYILNERNSLITYNWMKSIGLCRDCRYPLIL